MVMNKGMTRQEYLIIKVQTSRVVPTPFGMAQEVVASTGVKHPEWDMNEIKTWDEWEHSRQQHQR